MTTDQRAELLIAADRLEEAGMTYAATVLREQAGNDVCTYEDCTLPAVMWACGRALHSWDAPDCPSHPVAARYCLAHANKVAGEQNPEYIGTCPHCGCKFGVN